MSKKVSTAVKIGLKSGTSAGDSTESTKSEIDLEELLTPADLQEIYAALQAEGNGYDNRLNLDRNQLKEFLSIVIRKGSEEQYDEFFDKVDATKLGKVDWYRIADHIFSEFEGKDDKNKQTTVPNWRPKRELQQNPHRDAIQKIIYWDKLKKYITVSKEGVVALWNEHNCELSASKKLIPDNIKQRDLWITDCVLMTGLGKIAMSNTCKEICIYELNTKLEFPCVYRIHNFKNTPYSLFFWQHSSNPNVSILTVGDTKGKVVCLNFEQSTVSLFDRPAKPAGEEKEQTLQIDFQELEAQPPPFEKQRENRTVWLSYHQWHQPANIKRHLQEESRRLLQRASESHSNLKFPKSESKPDMTRPSRKLATPGASVRTLATPGTTRRSSQMSNVDRVTTAAGEDEIMRKQVFEQDIWARQVMYIAQLDCVISCTTSTESSLVLAWRKPGLMKFLPPLKLTGGVHAFDFNEETNMIGIACADRNVYLYNPFVMSKPAGVLRGHMAAVIAVQFNKKRNHILSFSKDRVLRVWDVAQQISLQRIAGLQSGAALDVSARLFFHVDRARLIIAIDAMLSMMALKPEVKNTVTSHEQPVTCARFIDQNQVISSDLGGNIYLWRVDTGKRSKKFVSLHNGMDISCLALNDDRTRFFTGSSDGKVKEFDVAGNVRKTFLVDVDEDQGFAKTGRPAEVLNVVLLKREILAVGWEKEVCVFRPGEWEDGSIARRAEWKGGAVHTDDIVTAAFASPITLATGSLDGEIVIWNLNSESPSKHLRDRMRISTNILSPNNADTASSLGSRPESTMSVQNASDPKSKQAHDEEKEECAVSCLAFVDSRMSNKKALTGGTLANLISCGAGGWVRFWNSVTGRLCAEFCAHFEVTTITMRLDNEDNTRLVTGDTDGYLKVWDIENYAMDLSDELITSPPNCISEWQAHEDAISSVELMRYKSEDLWLVLSSSIDLTINLWIIDGTHIGTFGQDNAWKIKKPSPADFEEDESELDEPPAATEQAEQSEEETIAKAAAKVSELTENEIIDLLKKYVKIVDEDLVKERFNVWNSSSLGVRYSEDRTAKRERKQPSHQRDFPYLYGDAMGKPSFGPHYSLETPELEDTTNMVFEKPKSITDDSLMRSRDPTEHDENQRLEISTPPKHLFEEKNLFTRSMLQRDHERSMMKANDTRRNTLWSVKGSSKLSTAAANSQRFNASTKMSRISVASKK